MVKRTPAVLARALVAVLTLTTLSCSNGDLSFRQDDRLEFTAPHSRELVELPVTVSWAIEDFRVVDPGSGPADRSAGFFGVFVDRSPVKPGRTLADVAGRDEACKRDQACPDAQYLADRGVYTTTDTSLKLETVAALNTRETEQLHEVTVVLLDSEGRRIGESAWNLQFKLRKRTFG